MDWQECCNNLIVKKVGVDEELIKSLINSSENKAKSEKMLELTETTTSSKITLVYDSLREVLEALALKNGYKIYNHECYTAFLKELIKSSDKGEEFDYIRRVRNSVNYYGKTLSMNETDKLIKRINVLREFVLNKLK